jgi:hypothetical protein
LSPADAYGGKEKMGWIPFPTAHNPDTACSDAGLDAHLLAEFVQGLCGREIHSFILIKDGVRVLDLNVPPYSNSIVQDIHSAAKTFTAVACGFAIQEGMFDLSTPIVELLDADPAKGNDAVDHLTVYHLLTMTAGQRPEDFQKIWEQHDWVSRFLSTPITVEPGTTFEYKNFCSSMLSAIIQRMTGCRLLDYLGPRLFDRLEIHERYWEQLGEGIDWGAAGLYLSVESMARFGYFLLNKGVWEGEQLLNADFVDLMGSKQIDTGHREGTPAWIEDKQGYGFQAWMDSLDGFRASGMLQQEVIVLPRFGVTAVISGGVCDLDWEPLSLFGSHLLPACVQGYHGGDKALHDAVCEFSRPITYPGQEQEMPEFPTRLYQLERPYVRWQIYQFDLHVEAIGIERTAHETVVTVVNQGTPTRLRCPKSSEFSSQSMPYSINDELFDLMPAVCGRWSDPQTFELTFRPLIRKMWTKFQIRITEPDEIEFTISFDPRNRIEPELIKGRQVA